MICETQLVTLVHDLASAMDNGIHIDMVIFEFFSTPSTTSIKTPSLWNKRKSPRVQVPVDIIIPHRPLKE